MRIVVTTPTGHIGGAVARHLLDANATVVLIARDAGKLTALTDRGATVHEGSLDDEAYVIRSTQGADALLWVTPPNLATDDFRAFQNRVGRAGAAAVKTNGIPRVVNVSSVGAEAASGHGPVNGLHDVEELLNVAALHITHLRPASFFENFLTQLDSIRNAGTVFLPVAGTAVLAMIATRDVARVAADRVLDGDWTGRSVRDLLGPADLSFDEAATSLSQRLGRPIAHTRVTEEQARQAMLAMGLNADATAVMLEMYRSFDAGTIRPTQARTAKTTTTTTLATWAGQVMAPLLG